MIPPAPTEQTVVPERCIELAPGSAEYVKMNDVGKLVLVRQGSRVLIAMGDSGKLAPVMVYDATKQAWNSNVLVDYPDAVKTRPAEGVVVQGTLYSVRGGTVEFSGDSQKFGGLKDGIFKEPTADVLRRLIINTRAGG